MVFSNLRGKEMILGRDFMKTNDVRIDHGRDRISIKKPIKFNNLEAKSRQIEIN